jgi:hypothetical protein
MKFTLPDDYSPSYIRTYSLSKLCSVMDYTYHEAYPAPNTRESWDWFLRFPAFHGFTPKQDEVSKQLGYSQEVVTIPLKYVNKKKGLTSFHYLVNRAHENDLDMIGARLVYMDEE